MNFCRITTALSAGCVIVALSGCNPITRHQIVSTIFDGVPSYPPPEEFCQEYEAGLKVQNEQLLAGNGPDAKEGSRHQPYSQKKCDDCHDKTKEGGLVVTKEELCFKCHEGFIKGPYVHGPAAVGECQACHEPHKSQYAFLLKKEKTQMCGICHREKRLSVRLHDNMSGRKVACSDCHDPHYGNEPYFLK